MKTKKVLHKSLKEFLILLIFSLNLAVFAQDTTSTDLDLIIEDAATSSESGSDVDWSMMSDALNDLKKNPLNLNTATKQDLSQIPFLSELLINALHQHIRKNGPLLSIYERRNIGHRTDKEYKF